MKGIERKHTFQVLTKRPERMKRGFSALPNPLPNVWLGVSVEDQKAADERIPVLLDTPAAVRFVSIEPMLGPVDLMRREVLADRCGGQYPFPNLENEHRTKSLHLLDWVILGGESGPGARPMHPDWARSVRDQCQAAGVPFLFKHWGEWKPMDFTSFGKWKPESVCVGKKAAGRLLDGREWNEFPEGRA